MLSRAHRLDVDVEAVLGRVAARRTHRLRLRLSWRRHLRVTGRGPRSRRQEAHRPVRGGTARPVGRLRLARRGCSVPRYLVSIHMLQFLLYVLGAAPLLLLGTPEWMARRVLHRLRLDRPYRFMARPIPAAIMFNIMIMCTHAPLPVDFLRGSQVGSFLLDMVWLVVRVDRLVARRVAAARGGPSLGAREDGVHVPRHRRRVDRAGGLHGVRRQPLVRRLRAGTAGRV